jgi:hypothetical protein
MSGRKRSLKGGRAEVATAKIETNVPYEVSSLPMKTLKSPALSSQIVKPTALKNLKRDSIDEALKPHIPEILKYYKTVSDKPASPDCIKALEDFRIASKKLSFDEVSVKAYKLVEPYFLPVDEQNPMEEYLNIGPDANIITNGIMAKYIHSVVNYNSAEEFLYAGTGYSSRKNSK